MGHDSELYNVLAAHRTPAETKAAVLAGDEATRNLYQAAARSETRGYEALTGQADSYVPVLTTLTPSTKVSGSGGFTLTCTGTNFNEDSKIYWGALEMVTTYVSATSLTASMGPATVQTPGTVQVSVKTDSSASTTKPFTIT